MFVVYDNIKYTKKGWINRNRMLPDGKDVMFSLPLKGDSDALDVRDRELAPDFDPQKLLDQMAGAYRNAPHFSRACLRCSRRSVRTRTTTCSASCTIPIRDVCATSASRRRSCARRDSPIDHGLRGQDRVLALLRALGATVYINAIGGVELYSQEAFLRAASRCGSSSPARSSTVSSGRASSRGCRSSTC